MQRKTLKCGASLACGVLALAAPSAVWVLKDGEARVEFSDKGVMKISPHGNDDLILILCQYTVEKQGRVKAKVTGHEGEAKEKVKELLPVGLEFSFSWQAKDDTATLDDVKGENVEAWKSH